MRKRCFLASLRGRLGLGFDAHAPRDDILAGTLYLRLMYDRVGYPGLFGALTMPDPLVAPRPWRMAVRCLLKRAPISPQSLDRLLRLRSRAPRFSLRGLSGVGCSLRWGRDGTILVHRR
jgi:hypothetical protein